MSDRMRRTHPAYFIEVSLVLAIYVMCLTFIGPGEFAKQKQEHMSGKEIFDQGS